jgi:hypothetical protein
MNEKLNIEDHILRGDGILCCERVTIMDGTVVTYSDSFIEVEGMLRTRQKANGFFELSVSRNAIMVHHCEIRLPVHLEIFSRALKLAAERQKGLR